MREDSIIEQAALLPTEVILPAIAEQYKIHYMQVQNNKITMIRRPQQELVLFGQIENTNLCRKLLLRWLRMHAKQHLIPWLAKLSAQTKMTYQAVNIRSQRSRWGSCSSDKAIHLNDKLLFLPPHLVTHVLLHELCHTIHCNHSSQFWQLLASFDPDWQANKIALHKLTKDIPTWTY